MVESRKHPDTPNCAGVELTIRHRTQGTWQITVLHTVCFPAGCPCAVSPGANQNKPYASKWHLVLRIPVLQNYWKATAQTRGKVEGGLRMSLLEYSLKDQGGLVASLFQAIDPLQSEYSLSLSLSFSNHFPLPVSGPGQVIVLPTSTTLLPSSLLQHYPLWFSYSLPLHLWTVFFIIRLFSHYQLDSSISWLVVLTQNKV